MRPLEILVAIWLIASSALFAADPPLPPAVLRHFEPIATQPIFVGTGEGTWDARIRERGWILREDDQWRMWYTGYDGSRTGLKQLGHATSPDGIHWTRDARNPLYREHWIEDVSIVKHDNTYYMVAEGFLDQPHLLTSPDGLSWTRRGLLDVRLTNGQPISRGAYGTPVLWIENDAWHLFYERSDKGIWLAKSTDLKVWTNVQDDPVLIPGPDQFDRDMIAMNQIVKYDGRFYAIYHGAASDQSPAVWASALAVSDDLLKWAKCAGNPLRPIRENKSSGQLIPHGHGFRLYTLHDRVDVHESR